MTFFPFCNKLYIPTGEILINGYSCVIQITTKIENIIFIPESSFHAPPQSIPMPKPLKATMVLIFSYHRLVLPILELKSRITQLLLGIKKSISFIVSTI